MTCSGQGEYRHQIFGVRDRGRPAGPGRRAPKRGTVHDKEVAEEVRSTSQAKNGPRCSLPNTQHTGFREERSPPRNRHPASGGWRPIAASGITPESKDLAAHVHFFTVLRDAGFAAAAWPLRTSAVPTRAASILYTEGWGLEATRRAEAEKSYQRGAVARCLDIGYRFMARMTSSASDAAMSGGAPDATFPSAASDGFTTSAVKWTG